MVTQQLVDQLLMLASLGQVILVGGRQLARSRQLRPLLQQVDRLHLDRMSVAQVLVELLGQIIRREVPQGRVGCAIERDSQPLCHQALLLLDLARDVGRLGIAREIGDALQQIVGRELHVLVGERVG